MKKVFLLFAFILLSAVSFGQKKLVDTAMVKVSWVDNIGTSVERSEEFKKRVAIMGRYKSCGYIFNGLKPNPKGYKKGLYMQFLCLNK